MFDEYAPDRTILCTPVELVKWNGRFLFQQCRSFIADAIDHTMRAAALKVIDLRTRALQIPVVIEQLQSAQDLLRAAADEGHDMRGAQKPVPVNEPDNLSIAGRQLYRTDGGGAFEAGNAGRFHRFTIRETEQ